jgi:uncharacterized protein YjbI with pentapeptide repeats
MIERARGALFFLYTFSAYCLFTLTLPDYHILSGNKKISLPIIGAEVSMSDFLMVAPFLLMIAFTYYWILLTSSRKESDLFFLGLPSPFSINNRFAIYFGAVSNIALLPFTLYFFSVKAAILPESVVINAVCMSGTLLIFTLNLFIYLDKHRIFTVGGGLILAILSYVAYFQAFKNRPPMLDFAPLAGQDLRARDLHSASIRESNLSSANLSGSSFQNADFSLANMSNSSAVGTNFDGAVFAGSILTEAMFGEVEKKDWVRYGVLSVHPNDNFQQTLKRRDVIKLPLIPGTHDSPSLIYEPNAESPNTTLIGADLTFAKANNAKFDGANFSESRLMGANFEESSFVNALFLQTVFGTAIYSRPPSPSNFKSVKDYFAQFKGNVSKCDVLATFYKANLRRTNFIYSDLRCVTFENADLRFSNFSFTVLDGSSFDGADLNFAVLENVAGMNCDRLARAKNWKHTIRSDELLCGAESISWSEYIDAFQKDNINEL